MLLYRLARTMRADDLTGEGAKRAGGRWNHAGTPVVYTAENGALAILEVLQYAGVADIHRFSMLILHVPDELAIQSVLLSDLPTGWNQYPLLCSFRKDVGHHQSEFSPRQKSPFSDQKPAFGQIDYPAQ